MKTKWQDGRRVQRAFEFPYCQVIESVLFVAANNAISPAKVIRKTRYAGRAVQGAAIRSLYLLMRGFEPLLLFYGVSHLWKQTMQKI